MSEKTVFQTLNEVDITPFLKEKNKMKYLPWSSCWQIIKSRYPSAKCKPIKTESGCIYHTDGKTCWVETEMTIEGETQNETLAVMDFRNQSIKEETVASTEVGKSLKRCMVKNAALFGLGLSLWNGEELSNAAKEAKKKASEVEIGIKNLQAEIVAKAKKLIENGVDSATIYAKIEEIGGKKNPNSIKDEGKCEAVLEALEELNVKKEKK